LNKVGEVFDQIVKKIHKKLMTLIYFREERTGGRDQGERLFSTDRSVK